jgi:cellulose biosynthesis protein BcsQ
MLAYTVYSEAGGVGKTTLAANLAKAEVRADRDVLVVDLDTQAASISHLLDVSPDRGDRLRRDITGEPGCDRQNLIETSEGIDVMTARNVFEYAARQRPHQTQPGTDLGHSWESSRRLLGVLGDVEKRYDTLIVDPPASADSALRNAIYTTRHVVIPFEPSGKGYESVQGLARVITDLKTELSIDVNALALVPNRYNGLKDQDRLLDELREDGWELPAIFRERASLLEGCWSEQCTAFTYVDEHRDRTREHELETLEKFDDLAAHIREKRWWTVSRTASPMANMRRATDD